MSASSRFGLQVITRMSIEWTSRSAGLSVYCSSPLGAFAWSVWTVPPNETLSRSLAIIQPPCVMSIVQFGLLTGRTQVLVAPPHGGPPFAPAQAVMTSCPGRIGPMYVKLHAPGFVLVVHVPVVVTEPVTVQDTVTPPTAFPQLSVTVAVSVWFVLTGSAVSVGATSTLTGMPRQKNCRLVAFPSSEK